MENKKFTIPAKRFQGENSVVSARLPNEIIAMLESISSSTGYNRNEVIQMCLEYALDNMEIGGGTEETAKQNKETKQAIKTQNQEASPVVATAPPVSAAAPPQQPQESVLQAEEKETLPAAEAAPAQHKNVPQAEATPILPVEAPPQPQSSTPQPEENTAPLIEDLENAVEEVAEEDRVAQKTAQIKNAVDAQSNTETKKVPTTKKGRKK